MSPDRILKELADLWVTTAKPADQAAGQAEESGGVLRACSMTLVAFVDDEEDAMGLGETIAMLMRGHPSRAIVVRIREGRDVLESRVFQQCWMPFGRRRQICCEQVEITASADHLCDVPSIVSPLAVPDLPSVVWLRSKRICDAGSFADVLGLGGKLIVDSSHDGAPSFATLVRFLDLGHIVGDLAWTRITELRQLIAQLVGAGVPRQFAVSFPDVPEAPPEAWYLFAWLQNAFPAAANKLSSESGDGGPIVSVEIDFDIDIKLHPGGAEYKAGSMRQTAKFKVGSDFDLLDEELGVTVHDPVFEAVLRKAATWRQ